MPQQLPHGEAGTSAPGRASNWPVSVETLTIGLKSRRESAQTLATVLPGASISSHGMRKLDCAASEVTGESSTKVKAPTPAKTMFLHVCVAQVGHQMRLQEYAFEGNHKTNITAQGAAAMRQLPSQPAQVGTKKKKNLHLSDHARDSQH